jgi:hypothetical protein
MVGYIQIMEPGSSVSIVSGYGLDDWAIAVGSAAEAKYFSCDLFVQTGSGAYPASCPMGTGGKARPGRDADRSSSPSSAEVVNEYELYILSPLRLHRCVVVLLLCSNKSSLLVVN